jgi:hypothetical protein
VCCLSVRCGTDGDEGDRHIVLDPDELFWCGVVAGDEDDVVVELDSDGVE